MAESDLPRSGIVLREMTVLSQAEPTAGTPGWRRLVVVLPVLVLLVLGAGAVALYAHDRSQTDRIAAGVSVEGVAIGGLSVEQARARLTRLLRPLHERPVVVVHGRRRFLLSASEAGLRLDIARVVAAARTKSRRGGFLRRVYRELRGRPLGLRLALPVGYSPAAVRAFARRVQHAIALAPRDARFVSSLTAPRLVRSRAGLAVRDELLRLAIRSRLLHPALGRRISLPTKTLLPDVTTTALRRRYRYFITVSRTERRLRLFEHLKLARTYRIAVGRIGLETPAGLYRINDKEIDPSWHVPRSPWAGALAGRVIPPGPADPLKARWLGFYDGAGIHGTSDLASLGSAASHGCIRMSIGDVIQLYDVVPLHTPIFIL
jgi:hypothetical protein